MARRTHRQIIAAKAELCGQITAAKREERGGKNRMGKKELIQKKNKKSREQSIIRSTKGSGKNRYFFNLLWCQFL